MTDVSGIPNMGFGGGGYFGGSAALGQPAMSAAQINAGMWGNYSPGQAQATLANIYGAGGFGAQPAYYAALGAAYGRQVAPSRAAPAAPAYYSGGGIGGENARDQIARMMAARSAATNPYAQMYRMPSANPEYFNPATYAGSKGNYGIPYNGAPMAGDIGFSRQSPMPNLGYNPGMQNYFANPGMNANPFQNRFGFGFQGQAPTMMPGYGETLTPMDRLGDPYRGTGGGSGADTGVGAGG